MIERWNPRTGETLCVDRDPDSGLVVVAQRRGEEGIGVLPLEEDEARWLQSTALPAVLPAQPALSEDWAKPLDERIEEARDA